MSSADLIPADVHQELREAGRHADGNVSDFELGVISRLVKLFEPQTVFEIGTFDGRTTLNMAAATGPKARIYTLDLPPTGVDGTALQLEQGDRLFIEKPESGSRFVRSDMAPKITQLFGDSASFDFRPYEGKIDFMFVDGSHSYEYVLNDSRVALRLCRPGAVILWHDYSSYGPTPWPGLTKALDELHESDTAFRAMKHISGTAIAMLRLPEAGQAAEPKAAGRVESSVRLDSAQPEFLTAHLIVEVKSAWIVAGQNIAIDVTATNTGQAAWLPEGAPVGPVRLGSRLLDASGRWLDISFSRNQLPGRSSVTPGESVRFQATVPAPPSGSFILDFDLVAEGVAWFSRNGSQTVRIPIQVT